MDREKLEFRYFFNAGLDKETGLCDVEGSDVFRIEDSGARTYLGSINFVMPVDISGMSNRELEAVLDQNNIHEAMEIRISIERNSSGNLFAAAGRTTLFRFRKDNIIGPQWKFYPEGEYSPVIFEGEAFPREYFENLCRAAYFIYMHVDEYPDKVTVVKGEKYLDWACD